MYSVRTLIKEKEMVYDVNREGFSQVRLRATAHI